MSKEHHVESIMYLKMKWQDVAYWGFIGVSALLFSSMILKIPWNYYQSAHSLGRDLSCCLSAWTYSLAIASCVLVLSGLLIMIQRIKSES